MRYVIALTAFGFLATSWLIFPALCMGCDRPPPFGQGGYTETVRWAEMYHEACSAFPEKIFHRLKPYGYDLMFRVGSFANDAKDFPCGG